MCKTKLLVSILCSLIAVGPASAKTDEVVLKTRDGGSWVTGQIVSIGDRMIVLQTRFGEMRIIRDAVTCEGQACPHNLIATAETADHPIKVREVATAPFAPVRTPSARGQR